VLLRDRRAGGNDAVSSSHLLWAELDTPDALERLNIFPLIPSMIIASGTAGHAHAYWQLRTPIDARDVAPNNRSLARALGADLASVDPARILRPPASLNYKHTPPAAVNALTGGVLAWERNRLLSIAAVGVVGVGLLWSNALAQHDVTLAPRDRLAELAHIDALVRGHGPTLINDYEVYADRHFLRDGAPVEPAEYRPYTIPLADGQLLTQAAWSDLDAFDASTLTAYPSIVTRNSPVASRPSSLYTARWIGRYYTLWQRPLHLHIELLDHVPLGDGNRLPFCGNSTTGYRARCSTEPAAVPSCSLIQALARRAGPAGARLVAYTRGLAIVTHADQGSWPQAWADDPAAGDLRPTTSGTWRAQIHVGAGTYALWLGGSFARGFTVRVDGRPAGRVKDELSSLGQYVRVSTLRLRAGVHTVALRYPPGNLTSGSGASGFDVLSAVVLDPLEAPRGLIDVAPAQASTLCGRPLDWIEVVRG
jgi:hypothetical protein